MAKINKIVVGNWKMNPVSLEEAKKILTPIKKIALALKKTKVIVCPPFVYLNELFKFSKEAVTIGCQDIFWESHGSYTGEVSALMAKNGGAKYSIIGHSERRALGETDNHINQKINAALREDLSVILCIGEKERDQHGHFLEFVKNELTTDLAKVGRKFLDKIIIAYEPIWAIGKSEAMTPRDMHEMSIYIRKILTEMYGADWVKNIPILYGGSVSPRNAEEMVVQGNVQGLLVGRDSLNPDNFKNIIMAAETA